MSIQSDFGVYTDTQALLSRAKQACLNAIFNWFADVKEGHSLIELLEAYRTVSSAWDHMLKRSCNLCACGHELTYKVTCRNCEPPEGEE